MQDGIFGRFRRRRRNDGVEDPRVTNTAEATRQDPASMLQGAMAVGGDTDKFIASMEVPGTAEQLVAVAKRHEWAILPTDTSDRDAAFTALGFVLGKPIEGDALFRQAKLPDGWTLKTTYHDMWVDIVDETGAKRGAICYKAAFDDRRAFMLLGS